VPHHLSRAGVQDDHQRDEAEVGGVDVGEVGVPPLFGLERAQVTGLGETWARDLDLVLQALLFQDPSNSLAVGEPPFLAPKDPPDPSIPEARVSERHAADVPPGPIFVSVETSMGTWTTMVVEGGSGHVESAGRRCGANLSPVREAPHEFPPSFFPNGHPSRVSRRRSLIGAYSTTSFFRRALS
jgi:hypothetical protein